MMAPTAILVRTCLLLVFALELNHCWGATRPWLSAPFGLDVRALFECIARVSRCASQRRCSVLRASSFVAHPARCCFLQSDSRSFLFVWLSVCLVRQLYRAYVKRLPYRRPLEIVVCILQASDYRPVSSGGCSSAWAGVCWWRVFGCFCDVHGAVIVSWLALR